MVLHRYSPHQHTGIVLPISCAQYHDIHISHVEVTTPQHDILDTTISPHSGGLWRHVDTSNTLTACPQHHCIHTYTSNPLYGWYVSSYAWYVLLYMMLQIPGYGLSIDPMVEWLLHITRSTGSHSTSYLESTRGPTIPLVHDITSLHHYTTHTSTANTL